MPEARRLKGLEDENARLRLLADAMLDNAALKDLLEKNVSSAPSMQWSAKSSTTIPVHKGIRLLASGLLLQPGHDEIRARRSQ